MREKFKSNLKEKRDKNASNKLLLLFIQKKREKNFCVILNVCIIFFSFAMLNVVSSKDFFYICQINFC